MTSKKYVPIFVDAKPQENIDVALNEHRCIVGLLASSMSGVPKLRQYKKTRPKGRKLLTANRIAEYLKEESIEVDVIGVVGRTSGQYLSWAIDTINRARVLIGADWVLKNGKPVSLQWKGCIFPISHVFGLCVYSGMLPIIALRTLILVDHADFPVKNINLFLDTLPHQSPQALALMKALLIEPEIANMWKQNEEQGYSFEFGVLKSCEDDNGAIYSAKDHPNFILVDWLAASCLAKVNPEQLIKEGGYSDSEVDKIAKIWDAANDQSRGSANIIDVDDPEYLKKVSSHWKKLNRIKS